MRPNTYLLHPRKKFKSALRVLFFLFVLSGFLVTTSAKKSKLKRIALNESPDASATETFDNEFFVPVITILKQGTVSMDCSTVEYQFFVANESTSGEIFENVEVTDIDLGGLIGSGFSGDDGDKLLEPGEIWVYNYTYNITFQDVVDGQVGENPASVVADVQGQMLQVNDMSHPTDTALDGPTVVDLSSCQAPQIGLVKQGQAFDLGGDLCPESIRYTFQVRNTGAFDLHEVMLTDPLIAIGNIPGPVSGSDVGNDGVLSPGETWMYSVLYAVVPEAVVGGNVFNQATVSAKRLGFETIVSDDSHESDFTLDDLTTTPMDETCDAEQAIIGLLKTSSFVDLDNDGCFESIRYEFTATNTGDVALDALVLNDPLFENPIAGPIPGTDVGNDAVLSLNESWMYEAFYTITLEDIANNFEVVNQATIKAEPVGFDFIILDDSDDNSLDENDPTITDLLAEPICISGIGLVKKNEPIDLDNDGCNETIRYSFTVKNLGTVNLEDVVLSDPMLGGDLDGPLDGSDANNDGILSGQEEWIYEAFYPITQADIDLGSVTNQATVTALEENTNNILIDDSDDESYFEDDNTVATLGGVCVAQAGIGIIKTTPGNFLLDLDGDNCPETIRYEFTVTNTGNIILHEIVLVDDLLGGIINGLDITTDDNNDGLLSLGESWVYEGLYPISQEDISNGIVVNQASVTANEQLSGNQISDLSDDDSNTEDDFTNTPTDGTCPAGSAIGLVKNGLLVDLNNDDCPETIQYTFTVTNIGATPLENITVLDTALFGNTPLEGPVPEENDNNDGILSIGETWIYEAFYPLALTDINAGQVENQATATAVEQGTENQVSDDSHSQSLAEDGITITSTVGACPAGAAIGLIKAGFLTDSDNDSCPDSIIYRFTVTNTGTTNLTEITISDPVLFENESITEPLPNEDSNEDGILSVGETWIFEAFYPLKPIDITNGQVENQAMVTAIEEGTLTEISDLSHGTSLALDGETVTLTNGACDFGSAIGLVKNGELLDLNGDDCPDTIQYTFVVDNIGNVDVNQLELRDETLFGNQLIDGPLPGVDENDDGILSVEEDWVFVALYPISQDDINLGQVENQAIVTAVDMETAESITDNSDFESNFEDRPTVTLLEDACFIPTNPPTPPIPEGEFEIFNGMTPNGDGLNDFFEIKGIENYPDNSLKVFNRWGVLVFEAEGYGINNILFTGHSEGRATIEKDRELPTGTYFYTLEFTGDNPGEKVYSGYLYINRN